MDAESAIIGFTHSASFWIIYLIFISNIKNGVWDRGTKICLNGLGHMTKMAAMPIYGKNLKKSSSLEPKGL